jgi:general nucleoside transport system permease protein
VGAVATIHGLLLEQRQRGGAILLGRIFFQHDPLVYLAYLLGPGLWVLVYRTRPGLKIRAVGEHPRGADAMGISVVAVRYSCVLAEGLAEGLGGAYLLLAYTQMWVDNMTAGRGWIALVMVIFGTWDPLHAALEAYLFGEVQALQLRLQAIGIAMPTYLLMMASYAFRSGLDHRQRQSGAAAPRHPHRLGKVLHPGRVMAT